MRALIACSACRTRRRKCVSQKQSSMCIYCSERGFKCDRIFPGYKLRSPDRGSSLSPTNESRLRSNEVSFLPHQVSTELLLELVNLYFDLIHDQFHSLFHRPSFTEDVKHGSAPRGILYAIMALAARFSMAKTFVEIAPRERSKLFYDESVKSLDLRRSSILTIQHCILLGTISTTDGDAATESVYYTVACRMANLLELPNRAAADAIEQEVNIRVWCTLCMVDVWSSKSVGLPRQMPLGKVCPLPIDEETFLQWRLGNPISPIENVDRQSSLLAQMVLLNQLLLKINDVIAESAAIGELTSALERKVRDISQQLDGWHDSIPEYMKDTPDNLMRYAAKGLGRIFVAVWLGYYHFGQLLFYQFLHEDQQSPNQKHYSMKCKSYAAGLCNLVYAASSTPNCDVRYNMVGHILVIASTIQIHTLLFETDELDIREARFRLEQNFEILTRLREYWPMLDMIFSRLQIFHEVCRKSVDSSFRMDQWMLKFLSEFAEPIQEKAIV